VSKRSINLPITKREDGVEMVGTSTVNKGGWAAQLMERVTGNAPASEPDDFDAITLHEPAPLRRVLFTVAGTPVPKGRPRAASTPVGIRMHTPKKTATYERKARGSAIVAMNGSKPFARPVSLDVEIIVPIPASWSKKRQTLARIGVIGATKKPDADNVLKAIKDAMNGVVYADDAQVVAITLSKAYGEHPRVEVAVSEIDKESA
jgi:Holliday junction resolvase RusA-like endonuclease